MQPGDDGPISWGPQGDRYLIGNETFVVGETRTSTGFARGQIATWSSPKGTAILRVDPAKLTVGKRNNLSDTTITPLPVMAEAYDALYHPAGRNIAVVGRPTHDSPYGIWLISNNGENPKLITSGEDAKRIRLLRWADGGNQLQFYAEHLDGAEHAHALQFPGLALSELVTSGSSTRLADLKRSSIGGVLSGDCAAGTARLGIDEGGLAFPVSVRDIRLVLRSGRNIVATRQSRCDGPEDIWDWRYLNSPTKLAESVTNIAVRSRAAQPNELPDDITAQAPG